MIKTTILNLVFVLMGVLMASAQDLIVPKSGDPISAYNLEQSEDYLFYTLNIDSDSPILRIAKNDVLMVRKADGSVLSIDNQKTAKINDAEQEELFPIIDESTIQGSLIAQGNCVYIPTDSPSDYEQAGQQQVKEMVKKWGYWTVVNKPEQAHFILQFTTQTAGYDISVLIVRPRKYYDSCPIVNRSAGGIWKQTQIGVCINWIYSSENLNDNIKNAITLVEHMKKLITNKDDKQSKKFFKRNSEALDANAVNNNGHWKMPYAD